MIFYRLTTNSIPFRSDPMAEEALPFLQNSTHLYSVMIVMVCAAIIAIAGMLPGPH